MIPQNIQREHILEAIQHIEREGIPTGRSSKKFLFEYNGKHYPPKYVITLANKYANSEELDSSMFSGGKETNDFLRHLEFQIVERRDPEKIIVPESVRKCRTSIKRDHDERCPECKETVKSLLERIYGVVESNYKFNVAADGSDFRNTAYSETLRHIFKSLQDCRGHSDFVRAKTLPNCDFFVPNPGFIVEFDETQHFTNPRKITLENYPENLKLVFPKMRWIVLCEEINARDNDPVYRDEQRAWYDTLRDFLPDILNLKPTVRLYSKEMQWCELNPDSPSDVEKFRNIIEMRKQSGRIEFKQDANPSLARIIIAGKWDGEIQTSKKLLEDIRKKWPEGKKVDCLVTCGAFLNFEWPVTLPSIKDNKNPTREVVEGLIHEAEKQCNALLTDGLFDELSTVTDYITLGVDSYKERISRSNVSIRHPHVELVCLIDLKEKRYYWVGKSYPTTGQEDGLVRFSDLKTHFLDLRFGKTMVLGCHDLNIFNPRGKAVTKAEWRRKIREDFIRLSQIEKPVCVLHHPHTTESNMTWIHAWKNLELTLPTVERYISAGRFDVPQEKENKLEKVLESTKHGETLDIIIYPTGS